MQRPSSLRIAFTGRARAPVPCFPRRPARASRETSSTEQAKAAAPPVAGLGQLAWPSFWEYALKEPIMVPIDDPPPGSRPAPAPETASEVRHLPDPPLSLGAPPHGRHLRRSGPSSLPAEDQP